MRLDNKIAVITGAASGIGATTARMFVAENAKVVVADILEDEGKSLVVELNGSRAGSAMFCPLDVTSERAWTQVVDMTVRSFGRIDILVNNAGLSGTADDLMSIELWDRMFAVNSTGAFLGTSAVVKEMGKNLGGSIVNLASVAAHIGVLRMHIGYSASKNAVIALTRGTAVQFGKSGIRCNAVLPGWLPPMRTASQRTGSTLRDEIVAALPLGRMGKYEEVANAILFLASDEASYITGTEIIVDGGYLAA